MARVRDARHSQMRIQNAKCKIQRATCKMQRAKLLFCLAEVPVLKFTIYNLHFELSDAFFRDDDPGNKVCKETHSADEEGDGP